MVVALELGRRVLRLGAIGIGIGCGTWMNLSGRRERRPGEG